MNRYLLETILILVLLVVGMKVYLILYNHLKSFRSKSAIHASLVVIYIAGLLWITVFSRSRQVSSSASFDFFQPFRVAYDFDLDWESFNYCLKSFRWREIISAIHLRSLPALLQIVLNIELFIPFGFLYRMMPNCSKKTCFARGLFYSFSFSLLVELIQWKLKLGLFEVNDFLNNTIGAFVGMWFAYPNIYVDKE